MTEPSLIERVWRAAKDNLGLSRQAALGRIDPLHLERFAVAVDGSVREDVRGLATPLFLSSVLVWGAGPDESELLPDGNAADPFSGFDVAGLRLMAGGQALVFHRELVPGASMTVEVELSGADLKPASSGPLLVLSVDRRYFDETGLVIECRETFLGREALA
ncbi:hypothetical protein D0Z08_05290 [Nocardioides immobilis]|uniref:N-terminal of MaoC-like dehydratase domain-containing protein n=1 Tax=Nocardioides immobilis TaxID=2049295 RepID=A0A417Y7A1_9ACTN|nr:hypothetical protein [Nocardioides immobilis]RHW28381.1 hypothetical protein D0Z08_05290 [Nocardioides immobilis]